MNNDEIMNEVLKRANKIEHKNSIKRTKTIIALATFCSLFVVVAFSASMPTILANTTFIELEHNSEVGSLLTNTSVVGYVATGVLSFILGVVITCLCYVFSKKYFRR